LHHIIFEIPGHFWRYPEYGYFGTIVFWGAFQVFHTLLLKMAFAAVAVARRFPMR
jgi:hypothetical protein